MSLAELTRQIAADPRAAEVEICIADNASSDGTQALVERVIGDGAPIVYRRHAENLGPARNVMAAVSLAGGDWCWLHSSDDLIAERSVRSVLALLDRHADCVGITVARANFNPELSAELEPEIAAVLPSDPERARVFSEPTEALTELGLMLTYLPSQIVRRASWEAAIAADPSAPPRLSVYYPHVVVIARMLMSGGGWAWVPEKLVHNRHLTQDLPELGGSSLAANLRLPSDLERAWTAVLGKPGRRPLLGRPGATHRALLERAIGVWAMPAWIDQYKARTGHRLRDDLSMLRSFTRTFWSVPRYWRASVPRLLLPHPASRALARWRERRRPPMPALAPDELCARVKTELPQAVGVGRNLLLSCAVHNAGRQVLRSTGPHAVRIGVRWYDSGGAIVREIDRVGLGADLYPGARRTVELVTPTPWQPGVYGLSVGVLQELIAWAEDVDCSMAPRASITVQARPTGQ